jgi:RHS repeat-associated protein
MLKNRQIPHICRKKHNALSQRVFKTAPLFAVTNPTATATPTVLAAFTTFFESLWSPVTGTVAAAQKSGMSYVYDEDGTLIAQTLAGGASTTWGQSAKYVHLPTASGPMPVAAIYGTKHYAVQSDHLNTPRRLIQSDGQVAWQWAYSAFGDEQPTVASNRFANTSLNQSFGTTTVPAVTFNLRYPGQYFDQESNLHYNYHRSYSATTGRYTQSDPIGLDGGWNRFGYVGGNPLSFTDPLGLAKFGNSVAEEMPLGGGGGGGFGGSTTSGAASVGGAGVGLGLGSIIDAVIKFCTPDDPCPICKPYRVGTIGWQGPKTSVDGIDGTRSGTGKEHYILFEVQQNPKTCECRWQENKKIAGHHYYSQPNLFMTVNLNGKGRPPSYP